ncbi:MAG: hypothetical protein WC651_02095, partial [Candidatus Gracilibacteria bacterium]
MVLDLYETKFLISLGLTVLLEVPVVLLGVWGLWKFFGKGRKFWSGGGASESGGFLKIIFVCVLAST